MNCSTALFIRFFMKVLNTRFFNFQLQSVQHILSTVFFIRARAQISLSFCYNEICKNGNRSGFVTFCYGTRSSRKDDMQSFKRYKHDQKESVKIVNLTLASDGGGVRMNLTSNHCFPDFLHLYFCVTILIKKLSSIYQQDMSRQSLNSHRQFQC